MKTVYDSPYDTARSMIVTVFLIYLAGALLFHNYPIPMIAAIGLYAFAMMVVAKLEERSWRS